MDHVNRQASKYAVDTENVYAVLKERICVQCVVEYEADL